MSHVALECVMSHVNELYHVNATCHIWMSRVTREGVMSLMNESCRIQMWHVTHEEVTPQAPIIHVTQVAVRCSVLQCDAVCCSLLHCVAVRCSVLQCVAVYCTMLQCVAVYSNGLQCAWIVRSILRMSPDCVGFFFAKEAYECKNSAHLQKSPLHLQKSALCICKKALYFCKRGLEWE